MSASAVIIVVDVATVKFFTNIELEVAVPVPTLASSDLGADVERLVSSTVVPLPAPKVLDQPSPTAVDVSKLTQKSWASAHPFSGAVSAASTTSGLVSGLNVSGIAVSTT